ncbi:MAG: endonuclease/exonuclease/phosphatase family protein, partial [Clostridia bacterium]|nr:endonuclease/exonuclease/phosphatase family protein [Clostridia bacterium]
EKLASLTGYYYYFGQAIMVCGTGPYGNGILSKYPIKSVEKIMIPDPETKNGNQPYETRCIIKATIDVGTDLTVMVSHFGLNLDERMNAAQTLVPALENEKCIFMGDLNTTPEEPILDGIRARMTDADDYLNGKLLSYPSDKPEIKIDYIFVSPDIKIKYADIPPRVVSDHRPYIAKIEI